MIIINKVKKFLSEKKKLVNTGFLAVGAMVVTASPASAASTTPSGETPSSFFGEMLDIIIDALPWIIILMLFNKLLRKT